MSVCVAQEPASEVNPSNACSTTRVTSSASVSRGARPTPAATVELRIVGEKIISRHVQSGSEGVQVGVHIGLQCQVGLSNANPGHLTHKSQQPHQ